MYLHASAFNPSALTGRPEVFCAAAAALAPWLRAAAPSLLAPAQPLRAAEQLSSSALLTAANLARVRSDGSAGASIGAGSCILPGGSVIPLPR